METIKKESIISRIKKLLSLTEDRGATKDEAATAAAMAQSLLFTHNLDMSECTTIDEPVEDIGNHYNETGVKEGSPYSKSLIVLYNQICRYNFCKLVNVGRGQVAVIGKKSNVEVCKYLYEYLSKALISLADKANKEQQKDFISENAKAFKRAFLYGAAIEIGVRLKEQQRKDSTQSSACTALVVVSDKQLALKVKEYFPRLSKGRGMRVGSGNGYAAGQAAGRTIPLSRGVCGNGSRSALIG